MTLIIAAKQTLGQPNETAAWLEVSRDIRELKNERKQREREKNIRSTTKSRNIIEKSKMKKVKTETNYVRFKAKTIKEKEDELKRNIEK